jgi:archaellum component FlaC
MVNITLKARLNGSICSSSPDFEMMDHTKLRNRDAENQHPISSIEGLSDVLTAIDDNFKKVDDNFELASEADNEIRQELSRETERLEEEIKKVDGKLTVVDKLPEIDLSTDINKLYKCGNALFIATERIIT